MAMAAVLDMAVVDAAAVIDILHVVAIVAVDEGGLDIVAKVNDDHLVADADMVAADIGMLVVAAVAHDMAMVMVPWLRVRHEVGAEVGMATVMVQHHIDVDKAQMQRLVVAHMPLFAWLRIRTPFVFIQGKLS